MWTDEVDIIERIISLRMYRVPILKGLVPILQHFLKPTNFFPSDGF